MEVVRYYNHSIYLVSARYDIPADHLHNYPSNKLIIFAAFSSICSSIFSALLPKME
jgi:hypothetical protein